MGSSYQNREVYDRIRQQWVAATPEEIVRQTWIGKMVDELRYPKELMAVEKELKALPHLNQADVPTRRIDLLCFAKQGDGLVPLLLIECKAGPLSQEALRQVVAYNTFIKAPAVAIVNRDQIQLLWKNSMFDVLPPFEELDE